MCEIKWHSCCQAVKIIWQYASSSCKKLICGVLTSFTSTKSQQDIKCYLSDTNVKEKKKKQHQRVEEVDSCLHSDSWRLDLYS